MTGGGQVILGLLWEWLDVKDRQRKELTVKYEQEFL